MSRLCSTVAASAISLLFACSSEEGRTESQHAAGGSGGRGDASGGAGAHVDAGALGRSGAGGAAGTTSGGSGGTPGSSGTAGGTPSDSGADGALGSSRTGGAGGTANDSGADGATDFDRLRRCSSAPCTGSSSVGLVENTRSPINVTTVGCVLRGLRDRTLGRYAHQTGHTFTNGSVGAEHVLIVEENGAVRYARNRYAYHPDIPMYPPEPGQRCRLKPASYFVACLAAIERGAQDEEAWRCAFGDGDASTPSALLWFESCAAETPVRCE